MRALIIEDEILAAQSLRSLIEELLPEAEILDILQTIDDSVEWFQSHPMPDLVFMDIHLADGSSFSIFDEAEITCPVVFTTAYDEYALKAFEVNSIDYLLKPISKKELERAIRKYENWSSGKENPALLQKLLSELRHDAWKSYLLIVEKDKMVPLPVKDIACIYIDTKLVKVLTYTGKHHYLDQTLDELMNQLNPTRFYRANRQYIIAKEAVKNISLWFNNKLSVNLTVEVPERILISKMKAGDFKRWIVK